jgi:hypothetical protein
MSANDDRHLERRPPRPGRPEDTRMARAVLGMVQKLREKFPDHHVCATYTDPLMIVVRAVNPDGATVAEEWIAK